MKNRRNTLYSIKNKLHANDSWKPLLAKPARLMHFHIWYHDWRQPKHNFLLMKTPSGRVKLKTVVIVTVSV